MSVLCTRNRYALEGRSDGAQAEVLEHRAAQVGAENVAQSTKLRASECRGQLDAIWVCMRRTSRGYHEKK